MQLHAPDILGDGEPAHSVTRQTGTGAADTLSKRKTCYKASKGVIRKTMAQKKFVPGPCPETFRVMKNIVQTWFFDTPMEGSKGVLGSTVK